MLQVRIHDELLPEGIDAEDIIDALTVDSGDTEFHPAGTGAKIEHAKAMQDRLAEVMEHNADMVIQIETLEAERDNWKESARFHLKNEEYYRKERDEACAELEALRAKVTTLEYELSATERAVCDAITQRDALHERIAFLEAANEAGEANCQTIKALLTKVGDAKLALETENARLLDVLGNLLAGIEAELADEGREIATLHNYGPADAWLKCAIEAARREFPAPPTELVDIPSETD